MKKTDKSIVNYFIFLEHVRRYSHILICIGFILMIFLPEVAMAQNDTSKEIVEKIKEKGSIAYNIVWAIAILVSLIWGVVVAIKLKTQGQQALKDLLWYLGGLIFMGLIIAIVSSFAKQDSMDSFNNAFG